MGEAVQLFPARPPPSFPVCFVFCPPRKRWRISLSLFPRRRGSGGWDRCVSSTWTLSKCLLKAWGSELSGSTSWSLCWRLQKQSEQKPANGTSSPPRPRRARKRGWGGGLPARPGAICRVTDKERSGTWCAGPIVHSDGCPPTLPAPQAFSQPRPTQALLHPDASQPFLRLFLGDVR